MIHQLERLSDKTRTLVEELDALQRIYKPCYERNRELRGNLLASLEDDGLTQGDVVEAPERGVRISVAQNTTLTLDRSKLEEMGVDVVKLNQATVTSQSKAYVRLTRLKENGGTNGGTNPASGVHSP